MRSTLVKDTPPVTPIPPRSKAGPRIAGQILVNGAPITSIPAQLAYHAQHFAAQQNPYIPLPNPQIHVPIITNNHIITGDNVQPGQYLDWLNAPI